MTWLGQCHSERGGFISHCNSSKNISSTVVSASLSCCCCCLSSSGFHVVAVSVLGSLSPKTCSAIVRKPWKWHCGIAMPITSLRTLCRFLTRMNWNNTRGVLSCCRKRGLTSIHLDLNEPSKFAYFILSSCMQRTRIGSMWAIKICLLPNQQLLALDLELLTIGKSAPVEEHTIRPVCEARLSDFQSGICK